MIFTLTNQLVLRAKAEPHRECREDQELLDQAKSADDRPQET